MVVYRCSRILSELEIYLQEMEKKSSAHTTFFCNHETYFPVFGECDI